MKKFHFPLRRVLDWRETQARVEEVKLESLHAERHGIDVQIATLLDQRERSDRVVAEGNGATGGDLAALSAFRRFSVTEHTRLYRLRAGKRSPSASRLEIILYMAPEKYHAV